MEILVAKEGRENQTMVEAIYRKIWELSPHVQTHESYLELVQLTNALIKLYDEQGRLNTDPFNPARKRTLSLPQEKIHNELKDSICVVTGGLGCVGTILVKELLKLDVKSVIILDINKENKTFENTEKLINLYCDIRNLDHVQEVFLRYQPDFVFHTAAKRNPGFAESHVEEAISTNVFGTLNVVKASEAIGTVKQMIFSSTGKASRYFTEEVYSASKKICEFILDTRARESKVKYTLARFTHILDNSLMNTELEERSKNDDYVSIHSPGKYVVAQNATEAAHLMLHALIYSKEKQCQFLTVRHLEWPVESLEMALYHIKKSGRAIPVIFLGNPIGYSEKFFRGQMDWSKPNDLNLLINVYEQQHRRLNRSNDIIISRISSPDPGIVNRVLEQLKNAKGEKEIKIALIEGLKKIVTDVLTKVDKEKTVDILEWGLDPQFLEMEDIQVSDFGAVVPLLMKSLEGSRYYHEVEGLIYHGTISSSVIAMNGSNGDKRGNFEIASDNNLYTEKAEKENNRTHHYVYRDLTPIRNLNLLSTENKLTLNKDINN